ncbi:MAG: hypothetical protein FJ082_13705 [Cyanobacteria bacterium K_Offshore_surface_m2_011]|nr:hypothetical protein [Cyanobacteria bacterium K_Offshore_surface_m2_011]
MNHRREGSRLAIAVLAGLLPALSPQPLQAGGPPTTATVREMQSGDRACYVTLTDAAGHTSTQVADFDICRQDLVGRRARFTYGKARVMASSCQGDPDCKASETVLLITGARLLAR